MSMMFSRISISSVFSIGVNALQMQDSEINTSNAIEMDAYRDLYRYNQSDSDNPERIGPMGPMKYEYATAKDYKDVWDHKEYKELYNFNLLKELRKEFRLLGTIDDSIKFKVKDHDSMRETKIWIENVLKAPKFKDSQTVAVIIERFTKLAERFLSGKNAYEEELSQIENCEKVLFYIIRQEGHAELYPYRQSRAHELFAPELFRSRFQSYVAPTEKAVVYACAVYMVKALVGTDQEVQNAVSGRYIRGLFSRFRSERFAEILSEKLANYCKQYTIKDTRVRSLFELLVKMLKTDPNERLSAEQVQKELKDLMTMSADQIEQKLLKLGAWKKEFSNKSLWYLEGELKSAEEEKLRQKKKLERKQLENQLIELGGKMKKIEQKKDLFDRMERNTELTCPISYEPFCGKDDSEAKLKYCQNCFYLFKQSDDLNEYLKEKKTCPHCRSTDGYQDCVLKKSELENVEATKEDLDKQQKQTEDEIRELEKQLVQKD